MKQFAQFLKESINTDMDILREMATGTVDYLNNEGAVDYDENILADYVSGEKELNFADFIIAIKDSYGTKLNTVNKSLLKILNNYPKENKEEVESAILSGIEDYI